VPREPDRPLYSYRLLVEYDGSRFSGWQEQKNARTVAGELRRALTDAGFEPADFGGAGRTDAGVHALGQVAHLRLSRRADPAALAAALEARLPGSLQVLRVDPAPARFHARHDAVARSYLYQLSRRRTAFAKRFVWWVKEPLDKARLGEAAALLPGRHDFRLFAEAGDPRASTLVVVERVELAAEGALVLLRLTASHFLWRMVRRVVGALVEVGTGRLDVAAFAELLAARPLPGQPEAPACWTAPASGLFLERVHYPGDPPLPPPAAVTPVPLPQPPPPAGAPPPGKRRAPPGGGARRPGKSHRAQVRRG
jgi:tRNA pseudouridine38-40 synthase